MDESENSELTEAEKIAQTLKEAAEKLVHQERMFAKIKSAIEGLNDTLIPKHYLVTNKITGEKEVTNLDEIFSEMIRHLNASGSLEGWLTKYNVIKLKEEAADILYGEQAKGVSKQQPK